MITDFKFIKEQEGIVFVHATCVIKCRPFSPLTEKGVLFTHHGPFSRWCWLSGRGRVDLEDDRALDDFWEAHKALIIYKAESPEED